MSADLPFLLELVDTATRDLPDVTRKRMFGCDAYLAGERVFALVWKTGRVSVKLSDPAAHAELMAHAGAEPCRMGDRLMSNWVLTPEAMHDDVEALTPWLRLAPARARSWRATPGLVASARKPPTLSAAARGPAG